MFLPSGGSSVSLARVLAQCGDWGSFLPAHRSSPPHAVHLEPRFFHPHGNLTQGILIHGIHTTRLFVFSCLQGSLLHMDNLQHSLLHACPHLWRIHAPGHRGLHDLLPALIFHREELPNVPDPDWDQDPACGLWGIFLAHGSNW